MSPEIPEAIPASAWRQWRVPLILATLAAIALIAGLVLTLRVGEGRVETIRVTKHSMLPESLVGTPDYYLAIDLHDKPRIAAEGYTDIPIGNGLDFKLPEPLELESIAHLVLMDKDVVSDDIIDRVDVRERRCRGQNYEFELMGPPPPERTAAYTALGVGGALLALAAILAVRTLAV